MRYNMVLNSEGGSTVVIIDDDLNTTTVTESHPNFLRIVDALRSGEDPAAFIDANVAKNLIEFSDRVSVIDGILHFDGDPTYDGLSDTIMRYHSEGRDCQNLVRFMERLSENPSYRSREQLFTWCQAKELHIDRDGFIIAYKGVREDMLSVNAGKAIVNGQEYEGNIPNNIGFVVEMPRSKVNDDPDQGCSHGLHVGNWGYASHWGSVLLEVKVDPADVVSVPRDSSYQKMRCCRYEVLAIHDNPLHDLDEYEPEATWDDEEALDGFGEVLESAPSTFVERLLNKFRGRNK